LKYKKKQNYTMNKKEFNYVSPTATVKEMQAEGVLCMSFGFTKFNATDSQHEMWGTDDDLWS
jgi:hypothetical protein